MDTSASRMVLQLPQATYLKPEANQLLKLRDAHPVENRSCSEPADVMDGGLVFRRECHDAAEGVLGTLTVRVSHICATVEVYIRKTTSVLAFRRCRSASVRVTACVHVEGFMSEEY